MEEGLPNAQLFVVQVADNHFADIIHFLITGMAPKGYTSQQKKELVVRVVFFSMIIGHLYKIGSDKILRCYVCDFERSSIQAEAHRGAVGGHYARKETM